MSVIVFVYQHFWETLCFLLVIAGGVGCIGSVHYKD